MGAKKRTYVMKARREQAVETRARIVEATVALHEEVGPARTTISAIAEPAIHQGRTGASMYRLSRSIRRG